MYLKISFGLCALMLAGCSATAPEVVSSNTVINTGTPQILVGYVEETDTFTIIDINSVATTGWGNSVAVAGMTYHVDDFFSPADIAIRAATPSGDGDAFVVFSSDTTPLYRATGYRRIGSTTLPRSGTAVMTGTYLAMMPIADNTNAGSIRGTTQLTADFSAMSISGVITNREFEEFGPFVAIDDVTLGTASIVNGAFAGTTTGGGGGSVALVASPGTWEGLIVGPDGQSAVGVVRISQDKTGDYLFEEMGVFWAE